MKRLTNQQRLQLQDLRSKVADLRDLWNEEHGVASSLEGSLLSWQQVGKAEEIIPKILTEFGHLIGPPEGHSACVILETRHIKSSGSYRTKAYQVHEGLPVYGATMVAFADENRGVYRVQSNFWREIKVTADQKIDEPKLLQRLAKRLRRDPEGVKFELAWKKEGNKGQWVKEHFPLLTRPKLYLYPVTDGFHRAYNVWAYQPLDWIGVDGRVRHTIGGAELMVDAVTGQILWQEPLREGQNYTDTTSDGLSTLQDSNSNYFTRSLLTVQDSGGNFFLLDRMQTPHIVTHDANGTDSGLETKLKNGTDISQDTDGHWNTTTTSCTAANRQAAQQPETDCHFNALEAWNFYHNLLGWDGFDDGNWGSNCPVRVAAHIGMDANAYFQKYSEWDSQLNANKYYGYLAFYDGKCVNGTLAFDFMAGDPIIFSHEYQHAVTFFGATKSTGEPGHLYGNDWLGAIREGYSDAIGCLRRGLWVNPAFWPNGATRTGRQPFRRIEYPRSTNTDDGSWYCDHYDDRDSTKGKYFHSTLLSHVAFLAGQGGVHQRVGRAPELIPVKGIGLQRTAEIFLYALTQYFDTIPTNLAGETLITAGQFLLDAAKDVSGSDKSCEYVSMRRALYAVGLYPYDASYNKQTYGGEACMLPWTIDWRFSQPYLGFPALWYKSPDLFINNNGSSSYDAIVGQENKLFARVRNIGDQALNNVKVRFYFMPCGTNLPSTISGWHPCKNQAGVDCVLDIATLAAGSTNISDPNNPPPNQSVHWYLDPAYTAPEVNHFCIRAKIECSAANHNHNCPNEVQSNVQHITVDPAKELAFSFIVDNWAETPTPTELRVMHSLPEIFQLQDLNEKPMTRMILPKNEHKIARWKLISPKEKPGRVDPPFDGTVMAKATGRFAGTIEGQISSVRILGKLPALTNRTQVVKIEGLLSGAISLRKSNGKICGTFSGTLNLRNGFLGGRYQGGLTLPRKKFIPRTELTLEGRLEPLRAVHFTQLIDNQPVGGVSIHLTIQP